MAQNTLLSKLVNGINGEVVVPGDKSISHRALILLAMAAGSAKISGLLEGEDVLNTAKALQKLGVSIKKDGDLWIVNGVGTGGLAAPDNVLDVGNSGTGVRLLMGLVASHNFPVTFTGDNSLRVRPMGRVIIPLKEMGVEVSARDNRLLPLTVTGNDYLTPTRYELPVPSAQVKSAILLAALNIPGKTTVIEPEATRDHTELMLRYLGADVTKNGNEISIIGQPELTSRDIHVPADPSSAAFLVVAALITKESNIVVKNVCINPLRTGLYDTLLEMGAKIEFKNKRIEAGEEIADIVVSSSKLKGANVPSSRAPSMIDEYPILSVAASFADGNTVMNGLEELKVKESNRLASIINGLRECGVDFIEGNDSLIIKGCNGAPKGGGFIKTHMDHRLAMSFLVMGMATQESITVDDGSMINTSFPNFIELMNGIGASFNSLHSLRHSRSFLIAIDGPAASGKGALAKRIASHFGFQYLDTGKLYRAVGFRLMQHGYDFSKEVGDELAEIAAKAAKKISIEELDNQELFGEGVGKTASIVSSIKEVRGELLSFQKNIAESPEGAVLDGRDIGTVVCPQADFKFFITAKIETRAERRYKELQKQDNTVTYNSVLQDIIKRDERDKKREMSPLLPAANATSIDTTNMDMDEVFKKVLSVIHSFAS